MALDEVWERIKDLWLRGLDMGEERERESWLDELCLTYQMENKRLEVELAVINKHNLMLKLVF